MSVLNQSFQDAEILIIDDGSTDNTEETINAKFGKNGKVRYFFKKNEERGAARNFGIKQAKGDYIVFLDSDDMMEPNYLMCLYSAIKANKEIRFFACKYELVERNIKKRIPINFLKPGIYSYDVLLKGNIFACNICCKNDPDIIPFVEQRDFTSMEDWIFLIQNLRNQKLLLIEQVGVKMTDHDGRSMANNQKVIKARIKSTKYLIEKGCFSSEEERLIEGFSYDFCAIHAYLDRDREKSLELFKMSRKKLGFKPKDMPILFKYFLGRSVIERIPRKHKR